MLSDMNHGRTCKTTEIVEEYVSSLQDLKTNSKPQINLLTILAEDYIEYASAIVEAVEAHLQKVRSEIKLPVLYLIDSIIKNVNGSYINLFSKNIVQTFCNVFEKVDESTRARMWKLRQTWSEIFPPNKLSALDVQVHSIDPAWPISSSPSSASAQSKSIIHVNPKFLSMQKVQQPRRLTQASPRSSRVATTPKAPVVDTKLISDEQTREERMMREELLKKQKELVALQQKKLQILQEQKHLEKNRIHVKPDLIAADGTLKKPILTTVPCDTTKSSEKLPSSPVYVPEVPDEPKLISPSILPYDPRIKTATALQNGGNAVVSVNPPDDVAPDNQPDLTSSESSSMFTASPVKARPKEIETFVPRLPDKIESPQASNDNKNTDNERMTQISSNNSSSSQKQATTSDTDSKKHSSKKASSTRSSSKQRESRRKSSRKSTSSSSPHKKSSKSRKRSLTSERHHHRSHHHHHHHRRHSPKQQQGLDEEEQFGSLIISPPQPTVNVFKDRRDSVGSTSSSHRTKRSSCRESSSRSRSPESCRDEAAKRKDSTSSKDEDLRAALIAASTSSSKTPKIDAKEDLDLRVLPMTSNKRQSTEVIQSSSGKKSKTEENFDDLFGKEDVDLRLLNPALPKVIAAQSIQPPTPSPPMISNDKDSWAKFKTPTKSLDSSSRSDSFSRSQSDRSTSDRSRDRSSRSKFYNKQSDDRGRRSGGRDYERNADRNIEIIMKEAAEQLNQGTITKAQYNKLIQDVLHMSEDEKLRAAQRKERESKIWDRSDKGLRMKEHGMHPRPPGPRWPPPWHQQWAHPPGPFQGHFRPMGSWHPRFCGGPMRPDFHQFHAGFNPRHPGMSPNVPPILPNGPINPLTGRPMNPLGGPLGPIPPGVIRGDGALLMPNRRSPNSIGDDGSTWSNSPFSPNIGSTSDGKSMEQEEFSSSSNPNSDELPPADPNVLEEVGKDTTRSINIDDTPREIRYYGHAGVIFMNWDDPRDIGFQNGARRISIDGKDTVVCSFNDDYREFTYEGEVHKIKLGAPTRELYIDDKWYQVYFGGQAIMVDLGNKKVSVKLDGPPPQVKIGTTKRTDLVLGKINLIINARSMVPVFLDSKPQIFHIEDRPCTLEFRDALQTVLLNGRPFNVEFGGLPKPILIGEKKHFVRFSVLPRGFRAGYVKIAGMKGEQPKETCVTDDTVTGQNQTDIALSSTTNVSLLIELDATSQDGLDQSYTSKSDLQLDVLSSVVSSAMAPSSGLSYQAEPFENTSVTSTAAVPLNELFKRLVESGIFSSLSETKKPEEEEKKAPEVLPVAFDKPETLKIKNPAMVATLYSGIQCSSCGARFALEIAARYSRHLDWHFRQNRKERDSSRKAHSRLWYYDVSDWIQFEEIEDLEDRAQSWFETEKQTMEIENAAAEDLFAETMQPSVPTGSDEDSCCQVCHESFEQFYNDEKEEWHLRPAISFEDKNFHPICLEDYKEKLLARTLEETATAFDISESSENNKDVDIKDIKSEDAVKEESLDLKTEDDQLKEGDVIKTEEEKSANTSTVVMEPVESKTELIVSDENNVEQSSQQEEIKDEESEFDLSLTVSNELETMFAENSENTTMETETTEEGSKTQDLLESDLAPEEKPMESAVVDSTQVEVKSTIDGNVELESTTSTIPATASKIKINITKSLNSPKESKDEREVVEAMSEEEEEPTASLVPASVKPGLQDRNFSVLPPVDKGVELSALCSIM
ncbi:uncharacterized protein LOC100121761 isoform X2 [Nasonia vitripennis]|uniref:CID domain-containing protein n=1 Tax=Nasonia vitripennis TaxID=7425 RepID=A0A7M7IVM9_NASVI|nr:uncharacterized protein LOC100121761 isoform X2 [Nasonia vitripennis]